MVTFPHGHGTHIPKLSAGISVGVPGAELGAMPQISSQHLEVAIGYDHMDSYGSVSKPIVPL